MWDGKLARMLREKALEDDVKGSASDAEEVACK